jgi:D-inositol-3-phosphate glycosyltransferase
MTITGRSATILAHSTVEKRIAIVTPDFGMQGGLTSWASFLLRAIREHSSHQATIVSVATARNDGASRCILKPSSWRRGPEIVRRSYNGLSFSHVGAVLAEVEPARYCPHKVLDTILATSDLILVVAGTPVWAHLTRNAGKPIILLTASFAARERERMLHATAGLAGHWSRGMTRAVSLMEPGALRLARQVFVLNRYAERRIAPIVGASRVALAPIGIDVEVFRPAKSYSEDGYLLVVGRMNDPRKNAEFLLRSYAKIRSRLPSAPRLVIAGEIPNKRLCDFVRECGLLDDVRFIHNPTNDQLVALYQGASLLLIPSAEEGFGIVAIEAMACGIPVVATKCTGPEEVITEAESGYLVSLDEDLFAEKIYQALKDPARRRHMAGVARSVAVERYSISAAAEPYLQAVGQLC